MAAARSGAAAQGMDLLGERSFVREARAVAVGKLRYREDNKREQSSYAILRRNTHRLEKGLIMRPRRSIFGLDFIEETVAAYRRLHDHLARECEPNDELRWAHDVLVEYFAVVDANHPIVARALDTFRSLTPVAHPEAAARWSKPFVRDAEDPSGISISAMKALARYRRSVRWYLPKPVPRSMIDEALEVARQAPSACNRQSFILRIFDDPKRIEEVIQIPLGTKGFGHNVPALAVIVGRLRAYPHARDRHAIYVDGALAAISFVFGLETQGLASCLINWADQEPQESRMAEALGLEPDERIVVLVAFGYPDPEGMVPYSAKRELDVFRTYN